MPPSCDRGPSFGARVPRGGVRTRKDFLRGCGAPGAGLILAVLLAFLAVRPAKALTPEQAERAHALSLQLNCMCGGCEDRVGTCNHSGGAFAGPCSTAQTMLKEIDQRVARGESDDLILQDFVQEYGPRVLVSPPAKGFDWLVWVMPVLLPVAAFLLVWWLVGRWRRRSELLPAAAEGPAISPELLERARRESGKDADE